MKIMHLKIAMLMVGVVLLCAPPCLAKTDGYFYVVGYSYRNKTAYWSPVFAQKVRDISYSDEEFVAEVDLLQKIEAAFEKYLAIVVGGDLSNYTVSAHGAYKRNAIAQKRKEAEMKTYGNKNFAVKDATGFIFK